MSPPAKRSYVDAARSALPKNADPTHAARPRPSGTASSTLQEPPSTPPPKRSAPAAFKGKPTTPTTPQCSQNTSAAGLPTPDSTPVGAVQAKARANASVGGALTARMSSRAPDTTRFAKKAPIDNSSGHILGRSEVATAHSVSPCGATQLRGAAPKKPGAQRGSANPANVSSYPSLAPALTFGETVNLKIDNVSSTLPVNDQVEGASSDSEIDGGARIDPKDPPYRSSTQKNRVGASASIIKTRRARAAEARLSINPNPKQERHDSATQIGRKRPVEDGLGDGKVSAADDPLPSSEWGFDPAPITSPRKRLRRANPVVHSDEEVVQANALHAPTAPPQESMPNELEHDAVQDIPTPASDRASDSFDYEGLDIDEYEASFIDDTADDIADMREVEDGDSALGHVEDVGHDTPSVDNNASEDAVNEYGSDMYTDADEEEQEEAEDVEGGDGAVAEEHDTYDSPPALEDSEEHHEDAASDHAHMSVDAEEDVTFGAIIGHHDDSCDTFTRYQDDPEYTFFKGRLTEDGTLVPELQDALLKQFYTSSLEKYQRGVLITWSTTEAKDGMVEFSSWGRRVPNMKFRSCIKAINFQRCSAYVNLARVALQDLAVRNVNGAGQTYQLYTSDRRAAICLSPVEIRESFLYTPPKRGLRKKGVTGSMHTQEYERDVGCVCTVFDVPELHAQIFQNAISFETRSEFAKDEDVKTSKSAASKSTAARSPAVAVSNTSRSTASSKMNDGFSLSYNSDIPVYDARARVVDFNTDLDRLHSFPRWEGEIPYGSFTVVAYTTNKFWSATNKGWAVGFNIQWVMVIGVKAQYDV